LVKSHYAKKTNLVRYTPPAFHSAAPLHPAGIFLGYAVLPAEACGLGME
jgi:hypothetical protein